MADDDGLDAIRQKRLAELQSQHGDFGVQLFFCFNYSRTKLLSESDLVTIYSVYIRKKCVLGTCLKVDLELLKLGPDMFF